MDSNTVIFDISSDEEPCFEEQRVCDDDYNWLTQLLETVDRENEKDDSDEVLVVGEYNPKPKSKSSVKNVDDDEDDDCVVLDGDPDNPVAVADDAASDGDDVLVVGQKGRVACRDYPHSRHLCVEFPFTSTPHERHCDLCHCYVCDSLAPCEHWGTGLSSVDHCHATDKQDVWKTQRELFRLRKGTPLSVPKLPNSPLPVAVPQLNHMAPLDSVQLAPNSMQKNQVSRPTTIRACPSTNVTVPNIISQGRNRQPGFIQGRNGCMPHTISQQGLRIRNNATRRDRGSSISNLGQPFVSSNTMFKRPGIIQGGIAMSQSIYGSSNKMNCAPASKYTNNVATLSTSMEYMSGPQHVLPNKTVESFTYQSSPQPNMGSVFVNTVSSRPDVYNQSASQPDNGLNMYEHGNQGPTVTGSDLPDFDFGWTNISSQTNQQISVENIQHHDRGSFDEPATVKEVTAQYTSSGSPLFHYKDAEYDSWLATQAGPVSSEVCMPSDLNIFSPEPPAIDAGMMYFDFEASWNGLTHA